MDVPDFGARTEELPSYFDEQPQKVLTGTEVVEAVRRAWRKAPSRPVEGGSGPDPPESLWGRDSPVFHRMLPGERDGLDSTLQGWWQARARDGEVTVGRRLRLERPTGGPAQGWTISGKLRRRTVVQWVPVSLELWPVHDRFTRVTLTPRGWVLTTRRYFRAGHGLIERFWVDLGMPGPGGRSVNLASSILVCQNRVAATENDRAGGVCVTREEADDLGRHC
ncbi:MAG: hypothetical protein JO337_08280 [Acidimicrobiales bacterium]|nr:hypothetical protein [Acidimicrobiales bacterium]